MTVKARKIRATNVADVQIQGVDAETAARLAGSLTSPGNVEADEIDAETVAGLQILGPIDTVDRLRAEVTALRRRLEDPDAAGAGEARAELDAAAEELKRPRPARDVVVPKLARAAEILEKGSQMTTAADKLGTSLAKLVPVAQALWHAAASLLGG